MPLLKVVQCVCLSLEVPKREGRELKWLWRGDRHSHRPSSPTLPYIESVCVCVELLLVVLVFFVDQMLMIFSLGLVIRKLLHPDNTLKVNHTSFCLFSIHTSLKYISFAVFTAAASRWPSSAHPLAPGSPEQRWRCQHAAVCLRRPLLPSPEDSSRPPLLLLFLLLLCSLLSPPSSLHSQSSGEVWNILQSRWSKSPQPTSLQCLCQWI